MKMPNLTVKGPQEQVLVIPRPTGDIVFKARALLNFSEFEKLVPKPPAPGILKAGESVASENVEDPRYKLALMAWYVQQDQWMFLKSLEASPGLEWEQVDLAKPETWPLYREELEEAGFNFAEIGKIRALVQAANSLDQSKYDEAKKRFLESAALPQNRP